MGTPLVDDINWICDYCEKPISKGDLKRPDANDYAAYHKKCFEEAF